MSTPPAPPSQSSTGLASNVAGALCYLLGPITGVLFFILEKEDRFVRFHAAHSIVVGVAMIALSIAFSILTSILAFIPILGWLVAILLSVVIGLGSLALWLFLMYSAFQGREWEAPVVGPMARRMV